MTDIAFSCGCGKMQLLAKQVSPQSGTRIVCYCKDCQAFAHFLNRGDTVLDAHGGTEIFQMPLAHVQITHGKEDLRCMRLTEGGLYRWYTGCCNTPIGNTMGAGWAFIGLIHHALPDSSARDGDLGPVQGYVQTGSASSSLIGHDKQADVPFPLLVRIFFRMTSWKLRGLNKPSSFFDTEGTPVVEPYILNPNTQDPNDS